MCMCMLFRRVYGHTSSTMVQWRTCWNIIIVHLATVGVVKWMIILRLVLACILMMMRMNSVCVIGKVIDILFDKLSCIF